MASTVARVIVAMLKASGCAVYAGPGFATPPTVSQGAPKTAVSHGMVGSRALVRGRVGIVPRDARPRAARGTVNMTRPGADREKEWFYGH